MAESLEDKLSRCCRRVSSDRDGTVKNSQGRQVNYIL